MNNDPYNEFERSIIEEIERLEREANVLRENITKTRKMFGEPSNDNPAPVIGKRQEQRLAPIATPTVMAVGTQRYKNDTFIDALTADWQTVGPVLATLRIDHPKIAWDCVRKRLTQLAITHPEIVEQNDKAWRLCGSKITAPTISPKGPMKRRSESLSKAPIHHRGTWTANDNGMPPLTITDVRERLASAPTVIENFRPRLGHGDCFQMMEDIEHESVDLILADPPFGTTGNRIDPVIDVEELWEHYRRILKKNGTAILFGSQPFTSRLISAAPDLFKTELIWIKNNPTGALHARNSAMKGHENIVVFSKGAMTQESRSTNRYTYNPLGQIEAGTKIIPRGKSNGYLGELANKQGVEYESSEHCPRSLIYCPKDKRNSGEHSYRKPVNLLEYLIHTYSNPGDTVLDSFMGSGSTMLAAMRSGRRGIGIELNDHWFNVAVARCESMSQSLINSAA